MSCKNCGNIRESLGKCIDQILGVRDGIGATLAEVDIITRTWTGRRVGEGTYSESVVPVKPSPQIVDFSHNVRVTEAGAVKSGDLILKGISRTQFPDEAVLRTDNVSKQVEKRYKIGTHYYTVIHIKELLVTWDVHVRKILQDENE